jgi:hypothetical protein
MTMSTSDAGSGKYNVSFDGSTAARFGTPFASMGIDAMMEVFTFGPFATRGVSKDRGVEATADAFIDRTIVRATTHAIPGDPRKSRLKDP